MSIDYNEYKYGVRMVAISNSASSFGGKVGSGLGTSIIGWFLAAVGYDAAQTVAPAATKMRLRIRYCNTVSDICYYVYSCKQV